MRERKKAALLSLRIESALKEAAEKAARAERRSLTAMIEKLIEDHVRAQGIEIESQSQP
ncbi:hypothetical protein [Marinivivus vitaminiproducens]|uniref:hypothetical protein n=1 Tax=Marinivivus vitaminiproducens TaxID=3035935 RepID=UPI00279F36DF|nr:hypothetical protein P4R82_08130 [Geminicoccaceae bacterium SCSIO 64248]